MSETKFTKGPWRVGTPGPNGCYTIGTNLGIMTAQVAHSINITEQEHEARANAHLISCAPEMYEMLEELSMQFDCETVNEYEYKLIKSTKELLAKARGEK